MKSLVLTSFRGPGFDHVRLVAAVIVLLHHSREIQYSDFQKDALLHYSAGYMDFGRFAVVIFFAISGFLVTAGLLRRASVIDYAVHRSVRILPGLIVIVLSAMLLLGPILTTRSQASYYGDPHTYLYAKNILTSMVRYLPGVVGSNGSPIVVNGALWTLHFEALSYIALGLLAAFGLLWHRAFVFGLWVLTYAIYVAIEKSPPFAGILSERFLIFISLHVFFGSGVLLYLYREHVSHSPIWACAALALVLVALPLGGGAIVMPICLPYLMVFCGLSVFPGKFPLKYDLSYGVYLIHAPILVAFRVSFPQIQNWWIGAAIIFVVTLFLAYLSWTFVEGPALSKKKVVSEWVRRRIEWVIPPRLMNTNSGHS
jgi:peptidoglycan/LPS O-acetylase OafA/YrhL